MIRWILTDRMWKKLSPLLPPERGRKSRPAKDNRLIVEGILWKIRTGSPWRDLPDEFGPYSTVFNRFNRWSKKGIWQRALEHLSKESDLEWLMVDSTTVKAHQHASGAAGKKK